MQRRPHLSEFELTVYQREHARHQSTDVLPRLIRTGADKIPLEVDLPLLIKNVSTTDSVPKGNFFNTHECNGLYLDMILCTTLNVTTLNN